MTLSMEYNGTLYITGAGFCLNTMLAAVYSMHAIVCIMHVSHEFNCDYMYACLIEYTIDILLVTPGRTLSHYCAKFLLMNAVPY